MVGLACIISTLLTLPELLELGRASAFSDLLELCLVRAASEVVLLNVWLTMGFPVRKSSSSRSVHTLLEILICLLFRLPLSICQLYQSHRISSTWQLQLLRCPSSTDTWFCTLPQLAMSTVFMSPKTLQKSLNWVGSYLTVKVATRYVFWQLRTERTVEQERRPDVLTETPDLQRERPCQASEHTYHPSVQ